MKGMNINPFAAAIILAALAMGLIGVFVVLPIACIEWTWNSVASTVAAIPAINAWQAALLYVACALMLHISGILRIEIRAGR